METGQHLLTHRSVPPVLLGSTVQRELRAILKLSCGVPRDITVLQEQQLSLSFLALTEHIAPSLALKGRTSVWRASLAISAGEEMALEDKFAQVGTIARKTLEIQPVVLLVHTLRHQDLRISHNACPVRPATTVLQARTPLYPVLQGPTTPCWVKGILMTVSLVLQVLLVLQLHLHSQMKFVQQGTFVLEAQTNLLIQITNVQLELLLTITT